MNTTPRRKSPRAPSMALGEAIEKASKIYDLERCHAAPVDGVAQHIGYKNAANGAALSALASLKYYGLLDRPREGMVAVSKDVESYKFAPTESIKRDLVTKWLKLPVLFSDLLEKYPQNLPSDATLKFELIQRGFTPAGADNCLQVFRKSVDFAHYFEQLQVTDVNTGMDEPVIEVSNQGERNVVAEIVPLVVQVPTPPVVQMPMQQQIPSHDTQVQAIANVTKSSDVDRIPVRLSGGRRAWVEIPMPFYEADKERLKRQIDLLLTNDDEDINDLV